MKLSKALKDAGRDEELWAVVVAQQEAIIAISAQLAAISDLVVLHAAIVEALKALAAGHQAGSETIN